ncbi:MAG TPA: hypothetical protein VHY22_02855 [Chthoniobacteraceae bacterium]|jgi:hypothetical protein|nr:hypothetical protein [Chthoniobacteraceae bacterium]
MKSKEEEKEGREDGEAFHETASFTEKVKSVLHLASYFIEATHPERMRRRILDSWRAQDPHGSSPPFANFYDKTVAQHIREPY